MKPKPGKAMTAAEADVIADGIKRKRDGGDQRRKWEQSPFDRYETELLLFVERGLTVAECLAWVKQQERRLSLPATRLGFWFTKHGWPREKRQEAMRAASEKPPPRKTNSPKTGRKPTMPKFNDRSQAVQLVDAVFSPGPKPENKADRVGKIYSEATREKYISSLTVAAKWAKATYGCRQLRQLSVDQAQAYLDHRTVQVGPGQLNQDRLALEIIPGIGHDTLDRRRSFVGHGEKATLPRAYITDDKQRVIEQLPEAHRLSAVLTDVQGLRAAELLTIRKLDGLDPNRRQDQVILDKINRREWNEDRFHGQGRRALCRRRKGRSTPRPRSVREPQSPA